MKLPFPALLIATGNAHKVQELETSLSPLGVPLQSLRDFPGATPVVEDGETLRENALKKAIGYAQQTGQWVLADDTGLEVAALGGDPGVRSARYAGDNATAQENRAKLVAALHDVPLAKRAARFVCHLAIADPTGEIFCEAIGECHGRIRDEARGQFGIGYDAHLEIVEYRRRLAEMSPAATRLIGHRGRATQRLLCEIWRRLR
ncbi:non-canonical purine NTP pyrophosphatase [Blastopirellula sp. JC732]|uniref:dITP/XTP pyrophosphatase n=1 Tax=Blastopirellula sediminis TaxID=2894196 RepID=A0A9X1SG75_9BACT|nr:non-canonical purine NTP pyrophosphatase [Blastopirellula sediminis]MCC9608546.1 non-canonical purine NTP pyrophosphatase [Blastopirellula sediminis]MCC9628677.1 non-canonical purine NTP pyrophosphatase [Blastopirellula sediminis]